MRAIFLVIVIYPYILTNNFRKFLKMSFYHSLEVTVIFYVRFLKEITTPITFPNPTFSFCNAYLCPRA